MSSVFLLVDEDAVRQLDPYQSREEHHHLSSLLLGLRQSPLAHPFHASQSIVKLFLQRPYGIGHIR